MDAAERLIDAIRDGEVLKVIYHGGSAPGSVREIAPIQVIGGKVRARCYRSNAVKLFAVSRIEILEGDAENVPSAWELKIEQGPKHLSMQDFALRNRNAWEHIGWHVECEETQLSLHRVRKNGKPLKGADVSLNYEEYISDIVMGLDGEFREENVRKRVRPWVVRGKNRETKTFGDFERAVEVFDHQARELAPASHHDHA